MPLEVTQVGGALLLLATALLLVHRVRGFVPGLDRFHIPTSLVAGLLLVLAGPHVAGALLGSPEGLIPASSFAAWSELPGLLINVVFAGLFLGRRLPNARQAWRLGAPQALFGQTIAWGQYVVGITLTLLILGPVFDLPVMTGALIEMGFQGGHGIAEGLRDTFSDLDFDGGIALTNGLATWGLCFGVILGTVIINLAERSPHYRTIRERFGDEDADEGSIDEANDGESDEDESTDPLALALGWVLLAIGIGWLMQQGLVWIEASTYGPQTDLKLLGYVPLFPLAMVGGVLVQWILQRTGNTAWIDRRLVVRICDTALDFTVLSAVATLGIETIGEHWEAFVILAVAGTVWCVFAMVFLARRMLDRNWLERGVCDFGQSMGMTAVGLMLLRIVDPHNRTQAVESFGYKQLLFEPFVGGGFVTTAAMPLLAHLGPYPMLIGSALICGACIYVGVRFFGPASDTRESAPPSES